MKHKINNEKEDLNSTRNQLDLVDMYRTLYPTLAEYIFSSTHETFSMGNYIRDHKTSPNKCKSTEIVQSMFSDHNGIKLETNNRKKFEKFTNVWKLNNRLLNNQWVM